MTDVAVDTLRIRGPHARRMARVAARALPRALDRALADVDGDIVIGSLTVRLDVDVDGCDDETLAILWAEAIRARVLAARRESTTRTEISPSTSDSEVDPPAATVGDVLAAARIWLGVGARRREIPRVLLALGDPEVARAVAAAATGPGEWQAILAALSEILRPLTEKSIVDGVEPSAGTTQETGVSRPAPQVGIAAEAPQRSTLDGAVVVPDKQIPPETFFVVRQLADLVDVRAPGVDPATVTRSAGLVLLYPWLAEHCRRAQELHPDLDPIDIREAALAAIVDPRDRGLADDPLVRLLAGRPEPGDPRVRLPLPREEEVIESAARVLTSFAALLPGFQRSTLPFLRASWIARLGLVDTARNPVLLLATTHPLDVVLSRLPYPIGLLKLPWSPPVSVRFRP